MKKDKLITREYLFENKEKFHREQAKLPFEEKIKMLVKLQEIAVRIKGDFGKAIWFKEER